MPCSGDAFQPKPGTRKPTCANCTKLDANEGKCLGELGTWREVP